MTKPSGRCENRSESKERRGRPRASKKRCGSLNQIRSEGAAMFERYTESARRVIFFARFEASQFGASQIEAEHILLGLIREGKNLIARFFPRAHGDVDLVRKEIEARTVIRDRVSTNIDLPLSTEAKRV